jgi:hypothetical protein
MCNFKWISDLRLGLQPDMLDDLTRLASLLDEVVLDEAIQDKIKWRFDPSGEYTAMPTSFSLKDLLFHLWHR